MRDEYQSFDVWLVADLRERFGDLEAAPDEWLALLDADQDDAPRH